jgi:hypothetical protein
MPGLLGQHPEVGRGPEATAKIDWSILPLHPAPVRRLWLIPPKGDDPEIKKSGGDDGTTTGH